MLPVALKWTLIGRFQPGTYPLWGSFHCRWWVVRKAIDFSPMPFLSGSPFIAPYARLLGAKVGRNVHIASHLLHMPDLLEIGDGASIGYDAELHPHAVENGVIQVAPTGSEPVRSSAPRQ